MSISFSGKGDFNTPLPSGFENGVNFGPESDKDLKYNKKNQKDATSGEFYLLIHACRLHISTFNAFL